jgi:hypothetical protein
MLTASRTNQLHWLHCQRQWTLVLQAITASQVVPQYRSIVNMVVHIAQYKRSNVSLAVSYLLCLGTLFLLASVNV